METEPTIFVRTQKSHRSARHTIILTAGTIAALAPSRLEWSEKSGNMDKTAFLMENMTPANAPV